MMLTIILDDEKEITDSYAIYLKRQGITDFIIYNDPVLFMKDLSNLEPAVMFLDLQMPVINGEQVLAAVKSEHPNASVVILTGSTEVEPAIRCMHLGALDYVVKPLNKDRFTAAYTNAVNAYMMKSEISALRDAMYSASKTEVTNFHGIYTSSSKMMEVFRYIEAVSKSSFPVLITGETGAGKELIARSVHECSGRKGRFVAVNVSGLDENMFSDTLFGHVKGAFTGADKPRNGLVAEAEGGTLFLDEIGDLNESAQIKLLRLIQEMSYTPLGSDKTVTSNIRIVTATNLDVPGLVRKTDFRQDLYFRLSTHSMHVPPLRERAGDIPLLANIFYQNNLKDLGIKTDSELPDSLLSVMSKYSFPGNVRQLQAIIADITAVFRDDLNEKTVLKYLEKHGIKSGICSAEHKSSFIYSGCFPTLKEMEQYLVDYAVSSSDGNITHAAKLLGITRQALHKRLKG